MNALALIDYENTAPNAAVLTESKGSFTDRALTVAEKDTIAFHLANSRSENTKAAYRSQWKQFVSWCAAQQDDSGNGFVPFPCAVPTLILYITHLAAEHRISKVEQAIGAIAAVHRDNLNLLPAGTDISFTHPHVRAALSSIRRSLAQQGKTVVKKPRHFDQAEIRAMSLACAKEGGTAQAVQDRAMLLLLVNAGLRSSEVVALRTTDLDIDGDRGVNIHIRNSKTDQYGNGEQIFVAALAPHLLAFDFTKTLREWLKWRETYPVADGDESLFLAFRKGGNSAHLNSDGVAHGITREAVTSCLLRCASRAGLESTGQSVSSHSGRHTMISIGFEKGLDSAQISKTSRHKSLKSLMAYDQSSHKKASVSVRLWQ